MRTRPDSALELQALTVFNLWLETTHERSRLKKALETGMTGEEKSVFRLMST